jgi:hypothetical protein
MTPFYVDLVQTLLAANEIKNCVFLESDPRKTIG